MWGLRVGEIEETITMLDARQTEIDTRITRLILKDMDQDWPWPEYPGLRRQDISLCLATGTLGPLRGGDGILAKAFADSLETCLPWSDDDGEWVWYEGEWEYICDHVRHSQERATYSDDEIRAGIERVLATARAAQAN